MRAALLPFLVWLMWHQRMPEAGREWLRSQHAKLLAAEMEARKARGIREIKTGVYDMSQEELDEHAKRF